MWHFFILTLVETWKRDVDCHTHHCCVGKWEGERWATFLTARGSFHLSPLPRKVDHKRCQIYLYWMIIMLACLSPNTSLPSQTDVTDEIFLRQNLLKCLYCATPSWPQQDINTVSTCEAKVHYSEKDIGTRWYGHCHPACRPLFTVNFDQTENDQISIKTRI